MDRSGSTLRRTGLVSWNAFRETTVVERCAGPQNPGPLLPRGLIVGVPCGAAGVDCYALGTTIRVPTCYAQQPSNGALVYSAPTAQMGRSARDGFGSTSFELLRSCIFRLRSCHDVEYQSISSAACSSHLNGSSFASSTEERRLVMKVGFIGAGNVTGTFGRHLITAGHTLVVSNSRGPETLVDFVV